MGGLNNLFRKMIPITFIICLVAFGISQIFTENGITYFTTKITQEGQKYTYFDFANYVKNINITYIKSAFTNVIDTKTLQLFLESFDVVWSDGYQLGDILSSVAIGLILLINIIITIFNIILIPIRLIAGTLLTAFNVIGINTNNNKNAILKFLKACVNMYRTRKGQILPLIPLIGETYVLG